LPRLHLIVGGSDLLAPGLSSRLEPVLVAGGSALAIHIRGRGAPSRLVYDCAREAVRLADSLGTTVFINDRIDVALASGAHGVHLREDSLTPWSGRPSPWFRRPIGDLPRWIGGLS